MKKRSLDVMHRRGDTWERMLLALGSRKPMVPRSIREWSVVIQGNLAQFAWHHRIGRFTRGQRLQMRGWARPSQFPVTEQGSRVAVAYENFQLAMAFLLFGGLRGYSNVHVALTPEGLKPCSSDDPNLRLFFSPKWIIFVDEKGEYNIPVPTRLVIEAVRLVRQNRGKPHEFLVSKGPFYDKHTRPIIRRFEQSRRRKYVREVGQHNCWGIMVEVAHTIRDMKNKDVKDLEVRPVDQNQMPGGAS